MNNNNRLTLKNLVCASIQNKNNIKYRYNMQRDGDLRIGSMEVDTIKSCSMQDIITEQYHAYNNNLKSCVWNLSLALLKTIIDEIKNVCYRHNIEYTFNIVEHDYISAIKKIVDINQIYLNNVSKNDDNKKCAAMHITTIFEMLNIVHTYINTYELSSLIVNVSTRTMLMFIARQFTNNQYNIEEITKILSDLKPVLEYVIEIIDPNNFYKYPLYDGYFPVINNDRVKCTLSI